ncbi:MAG: 1-deoxy-D-xylulose-5-phosphate synthase [Kiritimatiellaeota bacterium]|nr:1-deoxy-D-xylulose-5-phosphate synthase [Kiritimatiellota bacterium]
MPLTDLHSASDIAALPPAGLKKLAGELRAEILSVVGANGGHLASNLGVVELTLALLRVFDPERDRVVWDVGHQAYAWKILTGRAAEFHTLRQFGGLSGFQKRGESPCDPFGGGHAGTAISAALGMAAARDRKGEKHHVVAVVGDAALANGISLEALNNLVVTTPRLVVVLNDNRMSIGQNVGALSRKLAAMLASPRYNRWKRAIETRAHKIHLTPLRRVYYRVEQAVKSFFLKNAFFEELGIRYVGPVDGHDLAALENALRVARDSDRPILLHVATEKGRGYARAEENAEEWHAVPPFEAGPSGQPSFAATGFSHALGHWLERLAADDANIVALSAAMTAATGLAPFAKKHPGRFFDVGICETHGAVFAAGLAASGLRPVYAVYSTFFQRAVDCMMHDICLQNLPVVVALDRAGVVGADGPTHHGLFDIPMLRGLPNLAIMQPRDELQLGRMLKTALALNAPAVIRYPRGGVSPLPLPGDPGEALPLGKAEVIECPISNTEYPTDEIKEKRGEAARHDLNIDDSVLDIEPSIWIWALGDCVSDARAAAALLRERGRAVGVVDARFIKPLDTELLRGHAQSGALLVTWENGALAGGFGSAVREALDALGCPGARVLRVGWPDEFIPQGTPAQLREKYGLTPEAVAKLFCK